MSNTTRVLLALMVAVLAVTLSSAAAAQNRTHTLARTPVVSDSAATSAAEAERAPVDAGRAQDEAAGDRGSDEAAGGRTNDEGGADSPSSGRVAQARPRGTASQDDPYLDKQRLTPVLAVERALKGFVDFLLPAAIALAGVGVLVMAIIQLLKDLAPSRRWYQSVWFGWYLRQVVADVVKEPVTLSSDDKRLYPEQLRCRIIRLAAAGDAKALFALPVEKFVGQLGAAAQTVLDDPGGDNEGLFLVLAKDARDDDVKRVLGKLEGVDSESVEDRRKNLTEARSRLFNQIQRTLDAIQIAMGASWTRALKWTAFALGFAFILTGVKNFVPGAIQGPKGWMIWGVLSAVGGFVAPVARDLVAALQSIRNVGK